MTKIARAGLAAVLCLSMIAWGCSTSWINIALQDLPVLVQIATSIIGIVDAAKGQGGIDATTAAQITTISAQVQTDLQTIQNLVVQYQATPSATLLSQIDNALTAVQGNLQAILQALHISNAALQTTIETSIALALTTVAAIQSLIPVTSSATRTARVPMKPITAAQLKGSFNAIVTSHGYGQFAIH